VTRPWSSGSGSQRGRRGDRAATGCLDALGPDVGPLAAPTSSCDAEDSNPALDVHFQADLLDGVFAAVDANCDGCHTNGGDGVLISGFDTTSYSTVRLGGGRSGAAIVIDGNPCDSILVQKLDVSPPFGARMPRNGPTGVAQPPLAAS
jgi:hypothetical protein